MRHKGWREHFSPATNLSTIQFLLLRNNFSPVNFKLYSFDSLLGDSRGSSDIFTFGIAKGGVFSSQIGRWGSILEKETCWPFYDCFLFGDESSQSSESKLLYVDPSLRMLGKKTCWPQTRPLKTLLPGRVRPR